MFKKPARNHPSIIFERLAAFWGFVIIMFVSEAFNKLLSGESMIFSAAYWRSFFYMLKAGNLKVLLSGTGLFLVCSVVIVISFLIWRKTFFFISDGVLCVERRTIFKKLSKLPASNISTVNIERNLFERLIGTAKVKVDINSSTTSEQTDFTFVLKLELAEILKEELIKAKGGEEADPQSYGYSAKPALSSQPKTIISFSPIKVITHQLLIIPFAQVVLALITFLPAFLDDADYAYEYYAGASGDKTVLVLLIVIGAVLSVVRSVFQNWNFTLSKEGGNIYIKRGLIRTSSVVFEADKINGVIIKQSLLARLFGLYSVEAAVIGLTTQKDKTPVLSLLTTKAEAERVLNECAPFYKTEAELIPCSKKSLVPYMLAAAIACLISLPVFFVPIEFIWISFVAIAIFSFFLAYMSYRTKALGFDERLVKIVSGILVRKTVLINHSDIQQIDINSNFIVKRFGIARSKVMILSANAQKVHGTGYFDLALLNEIAGRITAAKDALSTVRRSGYEQKV